VPNGHDQTVYLVAEDFGKNGSAWRETDYDAADLETLIQNLLSGEYSNPIRGHCLQHSRTLVGRRFTRRRP